MESKFPISYQYLNVLRRRVEPRPRKVVIHPELTCPESCREGYAALVFNLEFGGDVNRHLSSNIIQANYQDGFLNDYGLHHFHLGSGIESNGKSKGFVKRTGPVLLAYITENIAYLIDIKVHGMCGDPYIWTDQNIIEKLHNEWPHSIEQFRFKRVLASGVIPTQNEKKELRKSGVNTAIEMPDGTLYMSPGGGVTCAKTSTKLQIDYNIFMIELKEALRQLVDFICKEPSLSHHIVKLKLVSIFDGYFFHDSINRVTYRIIFDRNKANRTITVYRWGSFPDYYLTIFEFNRLAKIIPCCASDTLL
ncbi:hypothetical protein H4F17_06730 [Vibrio cholerae]